MKAYGIKKKDWGCCPGHDKFSDQKYNTRSSEKAHTRDTKYAHRRERLQIKNTIKKDLLNEND
jgi:hypothetical protein